MWLVKSRSVWLHYKKLYGYKEEGFHVDETLPLVGTLSILIDILVDGD